MCKCIYPNCNDGHYPLGMDEETEEIEWGGCPECVVNGIHICDNQPKTHEQ